MRAPRSIRDVAEAQANGTTVYYPKIGLTVRRKAELAMEAWDGFGRSVCGGGTIYSRRECLTQPVAFEGNWIYYDGVAPDGIQVGKYGFRCPLCSMKTVAGVEEAQNHLEGVRMAEQQAVIDAHRAVVSKRT